MTVAESLIRFMGSRKLLSSSPCYLRDLITIQPSRSTRSSTLVILPQPSVTPVSRSQTTFSGRPHLISGSSFLLLFVFFISAVHGSRNFTTRCFGSHWCMAYWQVRQIKPAQLDFGCALQYSHTYLPTNIFMTTICLIVYGGHLCPVRDNIVNVIY